ncbi:hypothetical protein [Rhizobiales bacterium]|uniref:hypothetical protein n=1 Tax=Pseudochrobactrum asaccharolyticum TaxID=354351 RepID=UPI000EFBEE3A
MKNHSDIWDIVEEKSPAYFDLSDIADAGCVQDTRLPSWKMAGQMVARADMPAARAGQTKRSGVTIFIRPATDDAQPALPRQLH